MVAAALRTMDKKVFTGIHIEAGVGFADVCGEVAAICNAVSHGYRDFEAIVALWGDGRIGSAYLVHVEDVVRLSVISAKTFELLRVLWSIRIR